MEEINIKISSKEVKVESKPLRVKWAREMAKEISSSRFLQTLDLKPIYKKIERRRKIRNIFL